MQEQKGWGMVYQSSYKRAHLKVLQAEHGYFEGSQHDRINRFRIAPFDTSVIFLQNEAGRAKWPAELKQS
jgi:phosphorylated CTD-interacting factor 1